MTLKLISFPILLLMAVAMLGCNDVAPDADSTGDDATANATTQASHEHATIEITADNYEAIANGDTPVLLDFWATWCAPCVALTPTLEELAAEYDGKLIVGKVNVDEQPELAKKFNISSIPALFYVKQGEIVGDQIGLQSKEDLVTKIDEVIAY